MPKMNVVGLVAVVREHGRFLLGIMCINKGYLKAGYCQRKFFSYFYILFQKIFMGASNVRHNGPLSDEILGEGRCRH